MVVRHTNFQYQAAKRTCTAKNSWSRMRGKLDPYNLHLQNCFNINMLYLNLAFISVKRMGVTVHVFIPNSLGLEKFFDA